MAHKEQVQFCNKVKSMYPNHFDSVKVLDVGSFDCNGNDRGMFVNSEYIGIDLTEGENVDIICPGQDLMHLMKLLIPSSPVSVLNTTHFTKRPFRTLFGC